MKRSVFPFTALVGQEKMKTALLLNAVDPAIGGVLISGQKGTGKSTAVRALAHILPQIDVVQGCPYNCDPADERMMCPSCRERFRPGESLPTVSRPMPLVELPLSATEDRVIGTLHVEQILATGERRFEPGLLAAANRGILYVDEVNLLDDHLVDILLDAAASGVNLVEREGISFVHPARFMLVGTMNPEEGELRPQFLDRFGLSLTVAGESEAMQRRRVVSRRIAFDLDPEGFVAGYADDEELLTALVDRARARLPQVMVSDEMLGRAVALAQEVKAQGHRADIGIVKTARALAAFLEEDEVRFDHIRDAARFVLPHRITTVALATAEQIEEKLEEALRRVADDRETADDVQPSTGQIEEWEDLPMQVPGSMAASNVGMLFTFLAEKKKSFSTRMN
ncbi:ATP-binding protein [Desulfofustis glycolicus]|uniref:Mg-protoporphyrin IX chelatase n=1 Tax=Desulfofustis glycolicus DSM 9705 TaxID=1121409 RepID=A0A1M5T7Y7_9BACT|nr:ATP-binding protein [Desulfofustis glycolicus]MCB2215409.1 ATP-binding protein [Desulfobulbaceae bacterium]SHH46841.1 magnesium chelatase subunit I [Desulfofustis glycolicus DSM 9705]